MLASLVGVAVMGETIEAVEVGSGVVVAVGLGRHPAKKRVNEQKSIMGIRNFEYLGIGNFGWNEGN